MLVSEALVALKRFGFDDADPLISWLNEGMHQFEDAHDWAFLQSATTIATAIGDSTLVLPGPLFKVQSVRDVTSKNKLEYLTVSEFERTVTDPTVRGQPLQYTILGTETIQFFPVTDLVRSFRVIYQFELTDMVLAPDAAMPGPTRIHYPIVQGAAMIALQAENEEDRAGSAKNEFESAIDRLWTKYNKQENDEPQQVTDVMDYGRS